MNVLVGKINLSLESWEYSYAPGQPEKLSFESKAPTNKVDFNNEESETSFGPVLQLSTNTVDIRGQVSELAGNHSRLFYYVT